MITKQDIENDLREVQKQLNRIPKKREYDRIGSFSSTPVKRIYGSWNNALEEIFNKQHRKTPIEIGDGKCKNCNQKTKNPKFCSKSCSTSYNSKSENGRKNGRTEVAKFCKICSTKIKIDSGGTDKCRNCRDKIKTKTGDYVSRYEVTKEMISTNDTQKYRRIRDFARRIAKSHGKLKECKICKYSIHVECAHIKPINEFSDDDKLCEINNPDNLIGLCPNHHWEFENGKLQIQVRFL